MSERVLSATRDSYSYTHYLWRRVSDDKIIGWVDCIRSTPGIHNYSALQPSGVSRNFVHETAAVYWLERMYADAVSDEITLWELSL